MGVASSLPFVYPTFRATPASYMPAPTTVRGPEDMLSSSLGQHILSYELLRGFFIPSFSMYDGSFDSYDHMLQRSINSFSELWAAFVSQYLCSVRQNGNISSLQTIFKREDESIRDFNRRFGGGGGGGGGGGSSNKSIHIVWMRSSRIFEGALGRPHHSSTRYPWIRLRQWKNCTDGRINIQH